MINIPQARENALKEFIHLVAPWEAFQASMPHPSEGPTQTEQHNNYNTEYSYHSVKGKEFGIVSFSINTFSVVIRWWVQISALLTSFFVITNFTMLNARLTYWWIVLGHKVTWETSITIVSVTTCPAFTLALDALESKRGGMGRVRSGVGLRLNEFRIFFLLLKVPDITAITGFST